MNFLKNFTFYFSHFSPLTNADRVINYQKRQTVEARCVAECHGNLTFTWTLATCPNETSSCVPLSKKVLARMISTDTEQALFYTSREKAYTPNSWYLLTFQATVADNAAVYGKTKYRFFVNTAPSGGKLFSRPPCDCVREK